MEQRRLLAWMELEEQHASVYEIRLCFGCSEHTAFVNGSKCFSTMCFTFTPRYITR